MSGRDLAREVTPAEPVDPGPATTPARGSSAIDTGIKDSIVRNLRERGVRLELHPCTVDAEDELLARDPDAVFLANGPGDPAALDYVVDTVRELVGQGAGVGHLPGPPAALPGGRPRDLQAARSATAAPTTRSRTWRPARSTSPRQNHGFAVLGPGRRAARSTPTSRCAGRPTSARRSCRQLNLYDRTVEGLVLQRRARPRTVQYHPEAGPGPARRAAPLRPRSWRRLAARADASATTSRRSS